MLTTLLLPTGGRATVAGHDVVSEARAVRASIGVALQEAALDPLMTGRELIRLQATLQGLPGAEGRRRADDLLERVDLVAAADRRVGTYSGGMQRRLDLAAALVHEPRVLFLDEPTTGLDPVSRKTIWEEVRALNDEARPSSSPPSTSRRPTSSPTTSPSSTAARSSPKAPRPRSRPTSATPHRAAARGGLDRRGGGDLRPDRQAAAAERRQAVLVEVERGAADIPRSCGRSTRPGSRSSSLELVHPTLDDVFVAKTGYHLEEEERGAERGGRAGVSALATNLRVVRALGMRSIRQTFRRRS
jgi:ABC-2 type transport system ATP-binding protein